MKEIADKMHLAWTKRFFEIWTEEQDKYTGKLGDDPSINTLKAFATYCMEEDTAWVQRAKEKGWRIDEVK